VSSFIVSKSIYSHHKQLR